MGYFVSAYKMDAPCGHRVNVFQLSDTPKGRSKCCAVGGVALPLVNGKMNKWIGVSMALDAVQSCILDFFRDHTWRPPHCGCISGNMQNYRSLMTQLRPPCGISNAKLFRGDMNVVPARVFVNSSMKDLYIQIFLQWQFTTDQKLPPSSCGNLSSSPPIHEYPLESFLSQLWKNTHSLAKNTQLTWTVQKETTPGLAMNVRNGP